MKYDGSGSPIRVDHLAADHEALERDVLELDPRRHRRPVGVRRLDARALGPDRQRVAQVEVGAPPSRPAGRSVSSRTAIRQASSWASSTVEAVGRRDHVVVHQPDPVVARVVRRPHAEVEAAGAAEVVVGCG